MSSSTSNPVSEIEIVMICRSLSRLTFAASLAGARKKRNIMLMSKIRYLFFMVGLRYDKLAIYLFFYERKR